MPTDGSGQDPSCLAFCCCWEGAEGAEGSSTCWVTYLPLEVLRLRGLCLFIIIIICLGPA